MVSRANDLLFKNRNEKLPAGELWASIAEAGQNGKLFQMRRPQIFTDKHGSEGSKTQTLTR